MVTHLSQRDHTDAVVAVLEAAGLSVGRGTRNSSADGSGTELAPPCVVVYPILGGSRTGPLDDYVKHAQLIYQITCVGETQAQTEWVRDKTEVLLDGITVTGRHLDVVRHDFGSSDARRDGNAEPAVFVAMPRYRVSSSPA
jgi:hypothetical protein